MMMTGERSKPVELTSPWDKDGDNTFQADDIGSHHCSGPLIASFIWFYVLIQLIYPVSSCGIFPKRVWGRHIIILLLACHRSYTINGRVGVHRERVAHDGLKSNIGPPCSCRMYTQFQRSGLSIDPIRRSKTVVSVTFPRSSMFYSPFC